MKTISLLQPWASLVALGYKKIETRSWNTKYRGELLIHASAKKIRLQDGMYDLIDHMERIGFMANYSELPYGSIIGKVDLFATRQTEDLILHRDYGRYTVNDTDVRLTNQELAFGDYSRNRFGWLLKDNIVFKEPIPCKGQLSIWNLPTELEASVRSQVGKSISHEQAVDIYRRNVWPRDEHGNHIEMSDEERLERINRFRCQGYF